jgi:hypothetical protein
MTYFQTPLAEPRRFPQIKRAAAEVLMVALVGLSATTAALAGDPQKVTEFAHKYVRLYNVTSTVPTLIVHAPSFKALLESQTHGVVSSTTQGLIGGIHQGTKAVTVGVAKGQPVRFEYSPGGPVVLKVGGQSIVTGLLAAHARPMASLVEQGNNGLVTITDRVTHRGKRGYRPEVAASYLDTEDGYWLLWADAIAENLFFQTDFGKGEFPNGLTIVDSHDPVTITSDGTLEVRGGEPRVAFWKCKDGEQGRIVRYDDLGLALTPRDQDDTRALETIRRVFKWAPVMRLAAESDAVAFRTFVRQLAQIPVTTVTTPRLLMDE